MDTNNDNSIDNTVAIIKATNDQGRMTDKISYYRIFMSISYVILDTLGATRLWPRNTVPRWQRGKSILYDLDSLGCACCRYRYYCECETGSCKYHENNGNSNRLHQQQRQRRQRIITALFLLQRILFSHLRLRPPPLLTQEAPWYVLPN